MAQLLFHNPAPVTCLHVSSPTKNHKEGIMLNFFCLPGSPCPARVPRSGPRVPLSCPPGSPSPTRVLPPGPPVLPPGYPVPAPQLLQSYPGPPVLPPSPPALPGSPDQTRAPRSYPGPPVLPPGPPVLPPGMELCLPGPGSLGYWPPTAPHPSAGASQPRAQEHLGTSQGLGTSRDQPRPRNI